MIGILGPMIGTLGPMKENSKQLFTEKTKQTGLLCYKENVGIQEKSGSINVLYSRNR